MVFLQETQNKSWSTLIQRRAIFSETFRKQLSVGTVTSMLAALQIKDDAISYSHDSLKCGEQHSLKDSCMLTFDSLLGKGINLKRPRPQPKLSLVPN